jgi:hypothetical protein
MSTALDQEWAAFLRDGMLPAQPTVGPGTAIVHAASQLSPARSDEGMRREVASSAVEEAQVRDANGLPPLTISTRSKNAYLNSERNIDIPAIFWALRVMPYVQRSEGVIKKQIKVQCADREQLAALKNRLAHVSSHAFSKVDHIDDPDAVSPATSFKFVAKLSIGLASKEVKAHRAQEKDAFYNSFTMVMRIRYKGQFKEIVVKVFNKNSLSLPGMLDDELRGRTLALIDQVLGEASQVVSPSTLPLAHLPGTISDVMVNSNFWCGLGLDRDKIVELMRTVYGLETSYDPTNYPGVICRYYQPTQNCTEDTHGRCPCNPPCSTLRIGDKKRKGKKLSPEQEAEADNTGKCQKLTFMLFRTGSVLIVGRCTQELLEEVHRFVARALLEHKDAVRQGPGQQPSKKVVRKKSRKRTIWVTDQSPPA